MSLGGLIPIGGGGGGSGAKKSADQNLTGGLISISASGRAAATDANDLDMSDFDVGDLLSDAPKAGKKAASSPKSKGKSSSSSPPKKKSKDKKKDKKSKTSSKKVHAQTCTVARICYYADYRCTSRITRRWSHPSRMIRSTTTTTTTK